MKLKRMFMGLIMALIYLLTICINVSAYGEISKKADLTISNLKELVAFRDSVNKGNTYYKKTVKLLKDIDMSSIDNWEPISKDAKPFLGTFNGNHKTISNINIINNNSSSNFWGLFGIINCSSDNLNLPVPAQIKNLNIKNVNITSNGNNVGGLIGYCTYYIISNCTINNSTINGNQGVGGLVGQCVLSEINNCRSSAVVTGESGAGGLLGIAGGMIIKKSNATGNISGKERVGGLIGQSNNNFVENCYATGDISGVYAAGGLVGLSSQNQESTFTNCYATGDITGIIDLGGFVGQVYYNANFINCYATGDAKAELNNNTQLIGGFAGQLLYANVTNCYSKGDATGVITVGGFSGAINYTKVNNCYSMGAAITAKECKPGGFAGASEGSTYASSYYNSDSNKTALATTRYTNTGVPIGKSLSELNDLVSMLESDILQPENIE